MKIETLAQRHKLIDGMIKKAFEFEESLIHDREHGDDWQGAMNTVENLVTIEEMIRTESIFFDILDEIDYVRSRNLDEKEIVFGIVDDGMIYFIDTMLLRRIEFTFDQLSDWEFETEGGKKFKKNYCKKLDALIKKYQDIYNL